MSLQVWIMDDKQLSSRFWCNTELGFPIFVAKRSLESSYFVNVTLLFNLSLALLGPITCLTAWQVDLWWRLKTMHLFFCGLALSVIILDGTQTNTRTQMHIVVTSLGLLSLLL